MLARDLLAEQDREYKEALLQDQLKEAQESSGRRQAPTAAEDAQSVDRDASGNFKISKSQSFKVLIFQFRRLISKVYCTIGEYQDV